MSKRRYLHYNSSLTWALQPLHPRLLADVRRHSRGSTVQQRSASPLASLRSFRLTRLLDGRPRPPPPAATSLDRGLHDWHCGADAGPPIRGRAVATTTGPILKVEPRRHPQAPHLRGGAPASSRLKAIDWNLILVGAPQQVEGQPGAGSDRGQLGRGLLVVCAGGPRGRGVGGL